MNFFRFLLAIFILCSSFNLYAAGQRKHVIIPKLGFYEMRNSHTGGYVFDTSSDSVYGFEYERRFSMGLSIGVEHMHIENSITSPSSESELDVDILFFISRYYFNYDKSSHWRPFVGLGAGYGSGETRSYGAIDGQAYQAMAGITYEWDRMGMYLQYKRMYSKIDADSIGILRYTGSPEFDISGQGLFAGLIVKF